MPPGRNAGLVNKLERLVGSLGVRPYGREPRQPRHKLWIVGVEGDAACRVDAVQLAQGGRAHEHVAESAPAREKEFAAAVRRERGNGPPDPASQRTVAPSEKASPARPSALTASVQPAE